MIPCPTCCRPPRSPGVPCPACGAVDRRRSCIIVEASSTYGDGDDMYVGRSALDTATLRRFYPFAAVDALDPDADVPQ